MPKLGTTMLTGASGETYIFNVYNKNMRFNDFIPGVYYVSCQKLNSDHAVEEMAIYLGESDNVDHALQSHEKRACFEEHNFNRVSFYRAANPETRKAVADDLLKALDPACND